MLCVTFVKPTSSMFPLTTIALHIFLSWGPLGSTEDFITLEGTLGVGKISKPSNGVQKTQMMYTLPNKHTLHDLSPPFESIIVDVLAHLSCMRSLCSYTTLYILCSSCGHRARADAPLCLMFYRAHESNNIESREIGFLGVVLLEHKKERERSWCIRWAKS
jgi:hypothetical protein